MSITTQLLDIAKSEQDLKNSQTENQLRTAQTQQLIKTMQNDDEARASMLEYQSARRAMDAKQQGLIGPGGGAAPTGEMNQTIAPLEAERKSLLNNITALRQGALTQASPKVAAQFDKDASQQEARLVQIDKDIASAKKEFSGRAASIAGAATPDNLDQTTQGLDDLLGPDWVQKNAKNLDLNLLGKPMWGPRTATFMKTMQQQAQTAEQQANNKLSEARAKETEARDKAASEDRKAAQVDRESRTVIERERAQIARDAETRRKETAQKKQGRIDKIGKAIKDPSSTMVKSLAGDLGKEFNLSPEESSKFAVDVLSRKAELMRDDEDLTTREAEDQAITEMKEKRLHKDPDQPGSWLYSFTGILGSAPKKGKTTYGTQPKPTSSSQPGTADEYLKSIGG